MSIPDFNKQHAYVHTSRGPDDTSPRVDIGLSDELVSFILDKTGQGLGTRFEGRRWTNTGLFLIPSNKGVELQLHTKSPLKDLPHKIQFRDDRALALNLVNGNGRAHVTFVRLPDAPDGVFIQAFL